MATFGVEMETVIPKTEREVWLHARNGGYHSGADAGMTLPAGWQYQSDSSIHGFSSSTHFGVEVVSPALDGTNVAGIQSVYDACAKLATFSAKPNSSCGLHVHVDGTGLNREQGNAFKEFFRVYEMGAFAVNGASIEHRLVGDHARRYCRSSTGWSNGGRMQSLNMTNWRPDSNEQRKNTFEARCFSGTHDANIVAGAVCLVYAIRERALIAVKNAHSEDAANVEKIPMAGYDHRIASPKEAMERLLSLYFVPRLLPALPDGKLVEIKAALTTQAKKAQAKLDSL